MAFGFLTRSLLSGIFVVAGSDAAKEPGPRTAVAQKFMKQCNIELDDTEAATLVQLNGGTMALAGGALALGIFPRLSALTLASSLAATTVAGHAFWNEEEEAARSMHKIQFLKNLGLIGALLAIVLGGKKRKR
ncbi:MAG: DoxX family membrane protein [Propionibacterium sp.]|nr:DoxX family membrane protein [Propionibacterium sp.]